MGNAPGIGFDVEGATSKVDHVSAAFTRATPTSAEGSK